LTFAFEFAAVPVGAMQIGGRGATCGFEKLVTPCLQRLAFLLGVTCFPSRRDPDCREIIHPDVEKARSCDHLALAQRPAIETNLARACGRYLDRDLRRRRFHALRQQGKIPFVSLKHFDRLGGGGIAHQLGIEREKPITDLAQPLTSLLDLRTGLGADKRISEPLQRAFLFAFLRCHFIDPGDFATRLSN
jgi:hypothetical protein